MPRILILDDLAREGLELLEQSGIPYEVRTGLAGDDLRAALAETEGAVCRSGVKITAAALEGNRRLRAIVRAGVGTDNIDKAAATRQGVVVMNTPDGNTLSTAEHTLALMLALIRNVVPAARSLKEGRWDRKSFLGTQLAGKQLGVIGMGRIGREVARRAQAFGMQVLASDPFLSDEEAEKLSVERVESVEALLPRIDILTVHAPLTDSTRHLIGQEQIASMRRGARVINVARGGIYDERALLAGLEERQLAGAALDVFETEPCTDSPLFQRDDVVCTPHLGASTEEAQTLVAIEAVQLLIAYLERGEIRHAVNTAAIDPRTLQAMRGNLELAWRLGLFLCQWHGGGAATCRLRYRGEVTQSDTRLLTSAFCAGLLERVLQEDVNIVNAEMLLKERGIGLVAQCQDDMGAFSSSITAELQGRDESFVAAGTLFGNQMPRLIRLGDYRLEAYLDGILLVFTHQDVPGIIGRVGTVLGNCGTNIAQMTVGRAGDDPGGPAVGVLNLDNVPPEASLREVMEHPDIRDARLIQLPRPGDLPAWLS